MMEHEIRTVIKEEFPPLLREIHKPPTQLYVRGTLPDPETKFLTIVGARRFTTYGRDVCNKLVEGLAGYNISIVSGLAIGMDSIAHKAALENNLHTIAIPGSGLNDDVIYPHINRGLAHKILDSGGALLSEFEPDFTSALYAFPKRNQIVAGMSHGVLIIEASEKSGSLITARLGMEYGREVMTVPGSIYSDTSKGPHMLIKNGATPITCSEDILEVLGVDTKKPAENNVKALSAEELTIYNETNVPIERHLLIESVEMPIDQVNVLLSALEIKGYIAERLGKIHRV